MARPPATPSRDDAEAIGLKALVFLTEDGERLGRFLAESGMSPGDLKATAGTREGLVAVLDHVLGDESLLMVFAAGADLDPAIIAPAREVMGGGADAGLFAASIHSSGAAGGRMAPKKASKRWPGPGG